MTKAQAEAMARREANKSGAIHFLVRLNPFSSASWVVREWSKALAEAAAKQAGDVVAVCPLA